MDRKEYEYIGDISQLLQVETCRLEGGKKEGVRATFVSNETGLNYTVIADRCMDIASLSFKGVNISYRNPCGIVGSQYYDRTGTNWLKSFTGGMVVTCGLDNVGNPCEDKEELGLHGRIGHTPAEEYCAKILRRDEENEVQITGCMRQSYIFGEKLRLNRKITSYQRTNRLVLEDEIINDGFTAQEYMQLYHCNIGYPFLSPDCEILIPSKSVKGANAYSQENIELWKTVEEPSDVGEMCFLHEFEKRSGQYCAGMFNHKLQIGFSLTFDNQDLDKFLQWRYLHRGEYVMGFEPATNYAGGKVQERKNGRICQLAPGASVCHRLCFDFFESYEELNKKVEAFQ